MNHLRLTYEADEHGAGKLVASVESEGFTGSGSAWFSLQALQRFSTEIGVFPIPADHEPTLAGGFWKNGALDQPHLRIQLKPRGPRGSVLVCVYMATPVHSDAEAELLQSVTARFLVNYGGLCSFQAELSSLVKGEVDEAVLIARPT